MSRRIHRNRKRQFAVPEPLLDPEALHGPLDARDSVKRIASGLAKLHRGLTRERGRFTKKKYLADAQLRHAYATYMLCAQAPKLMAVLERIGPLPNLGRPLRVLELGCGPGTGASILGLLAEEEGIDLDYTGTDWSPSALKEAERLTEVMGFKEMKFSQLDMSKALARQLGTQDPFDLILCMNVLNELPSERLILLVNELKKWLTPAGVALVIEPAAMAQSRHIIEMRERVVQAGLSVLAPCTHTHACPALERDDDWCHDTWAFSRPDFMAAVDRIVGTRRETLKATWFAFGRRPPRDEASSNIVRVVSERFQEKGRTHALVCGTDGFRKIELQKRDRTPENKSFWSAERYDLLSLDNLTVVGHRHRLETQSTCHQLSQTDLLKAEFDA